jgi:hypothetical protein
MKRVAIVALALMAVFSVFWLARASGTQAGAAGATTMHHMDLPAAGGGVRFLPVDILLDTGDRPLGAYQVEVVAHGASIVGLEGGDATPFKAAPFYDPAALQGGGAEGRIIVAAFSTDAQLPTGQTRVARLHLVMNGAGEGVAGAAKPDLTSKLVVATDGNGQTIQTKLELRASAATGTPQGEIK